ncbi:MAG: NifB/NifX family molybdenum-iron cluster-binding protein [Candidatus Thorarchaeota archaeon]|nr:NifB/NifX family molybdenum-iron cluster-binding protein [Candidatus Thorarchaeota archaeon]
MSSVKVAIPVDGNQGLDAPVSAHFGHCKAFLVSTIEDGQITKTETLVNPPHSACAEPVINLANNGVQILIAQGMGGRPYMVTQQVGMAVIRGEGSTAREVIENYLKNNLSEFGQDALCGGGLDHQKH